MIEFAGTTDTAWRCVCELKNLGHQMQQPLLESLVPAMDASLHQMESFMAQQPSDVVRSILRRRRRAVSTLRTLLRWAGRPTNESHSRAAGKGRVSLQNLWQSERNLIELYDAALSHTPNYTLEKGLLKSQRAEADQAFLTLAAEIQGNEFAEIPPKSGIFA
ncbi:MAG: hypothetical protein ABIV25_06140 [Paracoccaceae bacterium]